MYVFVIMVYGFGKLAMYNKLLVIYIKQENWKRFYTTNL